MTHGTRRFASRRQFEIDIVVTIVLALMIASVLGPVALAVGLAIVRRSYPEASLTDAAAALKPPQHNIIISLVMPRRRHAQDTVGSQLSETPKRPPQRGER
jgi:hypothetical protein